MSRFFQWRYLALVIIAILIAWGGYRIFMTTMMARFMSETGGMSKVVEVVSVKKGDIAQTIRLIGTIWPEHTAMLVSKAPGTLHPAVKAGDRVIKDAVVARIENLEIETIYELSDAGEKIARSQYVRSDQLLESGIASKSATESKESIWVESQKALSSAKIELDKLIMKAPFDGVVGVFRYREGAYVQPGTEIVSVYDPSSAIVELDIPSNIVASVSDHQSVTVNGNPYALTHVQRLVDEKTHMCPAFIDVSSHNFVIGSSVDVDLTLEYHKDVLILPTDAVFLRNGKDFVYKIDDGKAILVPVTLGIREKGRVEIKSGLEAADIVVSCNQTRLYPGALVKVHQSTTETAIKSEEL